jgi:transcription elongation factor Elf1
MQEKLQILRDVLGRSKKSNDEHLFRCPYCDHSKYKFSVNINKNVYKCWICDTRGRNLKRVVRRFGTFKQRQAWNQLTDEVDLTSFDSIFEATTEPKIEQKVDLPKEFISLANSNLPITAKPAMKYLRERNVTKSDILKWKIGYCSSGEYENRIIFPSFNKEGFANYFVARTYIDHWKRYINPPVSNNVLFNELYIDWNNDLCIVEGVFDAIVAGNAIPLLGSSLRDSSKLLQEIIRHDTPIYLAMDPDAKEKEQKIAKLLMQYDIELYKIDISGFDDVGEMTRQQFCNRKENAAFITPDNYLLYEALNAI